jgi:cell division protein FtsN
VAGEPKKVHTIAIRPDTGQPVAMGSPMPLEAAAPPATPPLAPAAPVRPKSDRESPARAAQASAPPQEAPLSLNPEPSPAPSPVRTASATPAASAPAPAPQGHVTAYAVQVASQKSEAEAKAAYEAVLKKYPKVLEGKSMFVYSVDLGAKGTFYRVMIGPYSVASEATDVCSALKSAGGSCLIQRN